MSGQTNMQLNHRINKLMNPPHQNNRPVDDSIL